MGQWLYLVVVLFVLFYFVFPVRLGSRARNIKHLSAGKPDLLG